MEEKLVYTDELKRVLRQIARTTTALITEVPEKSTEQFLAEIEFVKGQLEELREVVNDQLSMMNY